MSVPPSTSFRRNWTLWVTGKEVISGPETSSSVGRLMAWTWPQLWPLLLPRSRYQRPPGHGSIFSGMGAPSGVVLPGPSWVSIASKVTSSDARTWISLSSWITRSSILVAVKIIFAPWFEVSWGIRLFVRLALGQLLDFVELVLPEAFEGASPLVERANCLGVGPVKHVAAVAADTDEADVFEDAEVLRDRRLLDAEAADDFVDGALLKGEVIQDVAAARLGDSVEGVGGSGGAWHELNIFPYGNMSRTIFGASRQRLCYSCRQQKRLSESPIRPR